MATWTKSITLANGVVADTWVAKRLTIDLTDASLPTVISFDGYLSASALANGNEKLESRSVNITIMDLANISTTMADIRAKAIAAQEAQEAALGNA